MIRARRVLAAAFGLAVVLAGCRGPDAATSEPSRDVVLVPGANDRATLSGAGSTFVAPVLREWISQYQRVAPGVSIGYEAVGSVDGATALSSGAVDFAASEIPLPEDREAAGGRGSDVVEIPWAASGVAVAYNLPGVSDLRLSATTLAAIFAGRLTRWDHPSITSDNPGAVLPTTPIRVVHRSDGSGTTRVFTSFLDGAAPGTWTLGSGPTARWPTGTAAIGSAAVVEYVRDTVGGIGYAETNHAARLGLGVALIRNGSGRFVGPTPAAARSALSGANPSAPGAYPITTVSYLAFLSAGEDDPTTIALRHFAMWVLTEGQRTAERLGYAGLPIDVLVTALEKVQGITREAPRQATDRGR